MSKVTAACFVFALMGCISAQFKPSVPWELVRSGRTKRISCELDSSTSLSSTAGHWYRAKPGEGLQRILYFAAGATTATNDKEFDNRFTGGKKDQTLSLTITKVTEGDAATYYCAVWKGDNEKVFSSGIRLYVTVRDKKTPKLSAYPVSRKVANGKHVLTCQARDMFPDMVSFTWKVKDQNGAQVPLTKEDEVLEQKDGGQESTVTSMLITEKQNMKENTYTCSVQHGDNAQSADIPPSPDKEEPEVVPNPNPGKTCPTPKVKEYEEEEIETEEKNIIYGSTEISRNAYLFSIMYVILVMKNVLYFGTVSILLYKRRPANKEMRSTKGR